MLVAVLFMAAMSVVGDLVESLVKRSAGAASQARVCGASASWQHKCHSQQGQ